MTSYQITSSGGIYLGTYQGESLDEAFDAMDQDAGYDSSEDAAHQLGVSIEALRAGLVATEAPALEDIDAAMDAHRQECGEDCEAWQDYQEERRGPRGRLWAEFWSGVASGGACE